MAKKTEDPGASTGAPGVTQAEAQPTALGLADRAETEAAVRRAAEAEKATIAAAVAKSQQSGTALLRAPKDVSAISIDGTQYDVEADGSVLVEERHVAALLGLGCTC